MWVRKLAWCEFHHKRIEIDGILLSAEWATNWKYTYEKEMWYMLEMEIVRFYFGASNKSVNLQKRAKSDKTTRTFILSTRSESIKERWSIKSKKNRNSLMSIGNKRTKSWNYKKGKRRQEHTKCHFSARSCFKFWNIGISI